MWQESYLSDLNEIFLLIQKSDIVAAKSKIPQYLASLRGLGSYDKKTWKIEWRSKIYELGKLFPSDATWILEPLEKERTGAGSFEALEFIYSEVLWNLFFENKNSYVKNEVKKFITSFRGNPEFHHTYSHILEENSNFKEAVSEAKCALAQEKDNPFFLYNYTQKVKSHTDNLLSAGKVEDANTFFNSESDFFRTHSAIQKDYNVRLNTGAIFNSLRDRIKDHSIIIEKFNFFSNQIEKKIGIEQYRLIELLGLFSAIIAFILSNITIIANIETVRDATMAMSIMALILIIFAMVVSYLFGPKSPGQGFWSFLKHRKFWSIIILVLSLFYATHILRF